MQSDHKDLWHCHMQHKYETTLNITIKELTSGQRTLTYGRITPRTDHSFIFARWRRCASPIHASLDEHDPTSQTASRSVQPVWQGLQGRNTFQSVTLKLHYFDLL